MSFIQYLKEMSMAVPKKVKDIKYNDSHNIEVVLIKGNKVDISNINHIVFEGSVYQPTGKSKNDMYEFSNFEKSVLWIDKDFSRIQLDK